MLNIKTLSALFMATTLLIGGEAIAGKGKHSNIWNDGQSSSKALKKQQKEEKKEKKHQRKKEGKVKISVSYMDIILNAVPEEDRSQVQDTLLLGMSESESKKFHKKRHVKLKKIRDDIESGEINRIAALVASYEGFSSKGITSDDIKGNVCTYLAKRIRGAGQDPTHFGITIAE